MEFQTAIDKFMDYLKSKDYAQGTIMDYRYVLERFNERLNEVYGYEVSLDDIDREDIENYLSWCKENGNEGSYRNKILSVLKSLYKYIAREKLGENITSGIRKVKTKTKEREYLTEEEIDRVLAEMVYPHIKYPTIFIYCTGARVRECLNIKFSDLDFDNKTVTIRQGKGKKDRRIAMSSRLEDNLMIYIHDLRPEEIETEKVFISPRSESLSRKYYNTRLKEAVNEAGIDKDITAHCLRHSTAVSLLKKDVPLKTIQDLLGHENLETTSVYLHADLSDMRDAVDVL